MGTLLAGVAAPAQAPVVVGAALVGALLAMVGAGRLARPVEGAVLAVTAAPLWLAAAGPSGLLGPAPTPAATGGAVVLGLAVLLAAAGQGGLPTGVRRILLLTGLVLALRAFLVAPELARDPGLTGLLALGTVLVGGVASAPGGRGEGRLAALALAVAALIVLGRSRTSWTATPTTTAQVQQLARLGLLAPAVPVLVSHPALGLAAVSAAPDEQEVGRGLLPSLGPEALVDVGWQPRAQGLRSNQVVDLAQALDRRGRGGQALRLAWQGRQAPQVAWTYALLARDQGAPEAARAVLNRALPPAGTPTLPGRIDLDWTFLKPGSDSLDLQAQQRLGGLHLAVRGQSWQGPPVLWVELDAGPAQAFPLAEGSSTLALDQPLEPGPHRLTIRYLDDRDSAEGDRNAWVDAVMAP